MKFERSEKEKREIQTLCNQKHYPIKFYASQQLLHFTNNNKRAAFEHDWGKCMYFVIPKIIANVCQYKYDKTCHTSHHFGKRKKKSI